MIRLVAVLALGLAAVPARAAILDVLFPKPAAEAIDPAAFRGLTHLIVVAGDTQYSAAQEMILNNVENRLRESGCWEVMGHAESRKKLPHEHLSAPSPRKWGNGGEVSSGLLSRMPRPDARIGVLVLWVTDWRGEKYSRGTGGEALNSFLSDRLKTPGTPNATRAVYERDAVAQLFGSASGAQIWRGHMFLNSGAVVDGDGRLPYAEQDERDANASAEYDSFISFFSAKLKHPPNMENGCTVRPPPPSAAIAPPPNPDAPALADLASSDPAARAHAALSLGRPDNEDAVPPLVKALGDSDPKARGSAIEALGLIGSPNAVDPLLPALSDPSALIRALSARALGRIGSDRAKPALVKLAASEKEEVVRKEAAAALKAVDDPMNMKMDVGSMPDLGPR
ncbi:MAG: HEAT repeat domain-containing protein [Elusimicrobia bacterium]|nr:HEAT repeat domain-containing protein [Elusimicrobiota bacterium]